MPPDPGWEAGSGYRVFAVDSDVQKWATAARNAVGRTVEAAVDVRRHGGTWFVGVDALCNEPDGAVDGVPLAGAWRDTVDWRGPWHRAQVSVVWPGYPRRDPDESEAAHRFRRDRDAAHLDGLLPEGPDRRRNLREPHAFIVGLPLTANPGGAGPLVVWPGSHRVVADMVSRALTQRSPGDIGDIDLTDPYAEARRAVLARCSRVEVPMVPGQAVVLHRMLIHGVAPWRAPEGPPRMVAYFRPQFEDAARWVSDP